jgi:muramoyltetrapeptide carboxypeptidase LdcA involved in peptidoglycan recycling
VDNRILGFAQMNIDGRVALLYVAPEARFRGISRAMLKSLEERALQLGLRKLRLESTKTAARFYEAGGYRRTGDLEVGFAGLEAWPMEKMLIEDAMKKPRALRTGDRVATVSLSWGGPGAFPHRYEAGKRQLQDEFGLVVVEMTHTLADPAWLARNPEARATDLMEALADSSIRGVVSTIGGEDSIRLLPFLDSATIATNPKVFVGYSDTTVTHFAFFAAGVVSFYGPAIMSGFAENCGIHPYLADSWRRMVFSPTPVGRLHPNENGWTVERLDWADPENQQRARKLTPSSGWRFLQGSGVHRGHLLGGCLEVLEWLPGTAVWPTLDAWEGALFFLETSEEGASPRSVARALRRYAALGVLRRISGILFGRPGGPVPPATFEQYDEAILRVVRDEEGLADLPVVSGMDFGHTDPFLTLPLGIRAEVDCDAREIRIVEAAVTA